MEQLASTGKPSGLIGRLLRSRNGMIYATVATVLALSTVAGTVLISVSDRDFISPHGNFFEDLVTSLIGVLVSAALIAPLTAFVVNLRREHQLAPAKAAFTRAVFSSIEELSRKHIAFLRMYDVAALTYSTSAKVTMLSNSIDALNEKLGVVKKASSAGSKSEDLVRSSAAIVRQMASKHYADILRDIARLDNEILFCIPLLSAASIAALSAARAHIIDFRYNINALVDVMSGNGDDRAMASAENAIFDVAAITRELEVLEREVPQLGTTSKTAINLLISLGIGNQRIFTGVLLAAIRDLDEFNKTFRLSENT